MKNTESGNLISLADARSEKTADFNKARYGELIRSCRKKEDLTQADLANKLGIPKTYVGHWEAGRSRPDLNLIPGLCNALGISLSYFFDAPESEDALTDKERHFMEGYRKVDTRDRMILDSTLETMITLKEEALWDYCRKNFFVIDHNYQTAAAGSGTILEDETETYQMFIRVNQNARRADEIVAISGSSMEPMFHHGQDVYVEHTPDLEIGEIGLFIVNGNGYIKQLQDGYLHSLNPEYDDIQLDESDTTRIVGRVLGAVDKDDYPNDDELKILQELDRENAFIETDG
ncbi:MAG: LexA family transcriptional regulator [Oscillospiraceae bacterium]|nr:LexA family transcriptional regulator [Clostridia bacterium]MBQ6482020.1 LexA family transcriptional regulator [Anaerolineaceae bacterium]MBR0341265.1 LexA family transcriptional regulator [Oscillospiraceae bacterium]